ncbi:MAG: archaeal proteasome endopeptidase complex subunit beta [Candidatus Hydrothermarchaeales archaeon]
MDAIEKTKEYMKGTTTVGLVCSDGVLLATDKRATMGTLIAHKFVQKSFMIDKHIGATVAGMVSDAQMLIRWIQAEARLYKMRKGEEMSIEGVATLMSNILHSQRYYPMIVQLIVGGVDKKGTKLYSIDPMGSMIEDTIIATGSGSPIAYGVLEDNYKDGITLEEGLKIGTRAMKAALKRDAMTGDGIDIVKITRDEGFQRVSVDEIN